MRGDTVPPKLEICVYLVNTQECSPTHFSNKSYQLIVILADDRFVHIISK